MAYQKIINLLENTPNQPTKFRTKSWVEVNYESIGTYNVNSQIKFITSMLRSSLCDYSDAYILECNYNTSKQNSSWSSSKQYEKYNNWKLCSIYELHMQNN